MNTEPDEDPKDPRQILRSRAEALAQVPEEVDAGAVMLPVVEFSLALERYAVETTFVREVCPMKEITPVPCTPPFILGVINVRGQIITVIDIKKFFDLPHQDFTRLNKVLIVKTADMEVGILTDAVLGARQIALHDLQPSLPTLAGSRDIYVRGITSDRLVVLDVAQMLADKTLIVDDVVES